MIDTAVARVSGVAPGFTSKLQDIVKEVGASATLTFSTDYTKPDLERFPLNGTKVTLVSSANPGTASSTRYNVTSVPREKPYTGYTVTVHIDRVDQQHAGTYVATDADGLDTSMTNRVEFIVICKY